MKRNEAAEGRLPATTSMIEAPLDLDADFDPEQETNEWVL